MIKPPPYFNSHDAIVTASFEGDFQVVAALIARGDCVDVRDEQGNTGTIVAAELGHDAIVELLVSAGSDVNATNNDGDSALDLASYAKSERTVALIRTLGGTGRSGPSANEQMENAYYDACQLASSIKSGAFSGGSGSPE